MSKLKESCAGSNKSMGWRRNALETVVRVAGIFAMSSAEVPEAPRKILVLRNNDIGDLLVVTPLFEALKKRFPNAEILAGIGSWNRELVLSNPYVDRVLSVNAPWHNKFVAGQSVLDALSYIYISRESRELKAERIDIGIDVLGSQFGSLLFMRASIPFRLGVNGYAGGGSAAQCAVQFDRSEHVGRQALRFAEFFGCKNLPEIRPQIFLDVEPPQHGAIVFAPGSGLVEKGWPIKNYVELAGLLSPLPIKLVGSASDEAAANSISWRNPKVENFCGKLTLRETFAVIGGARLVICNSSMAMHASAAFKRPAIVVLGEHFDSAEHHNCQWGYPEAIMLGREPEHPNIYDPVEVASIARGLFNVSAINI